MISLRTRLQKRRVEQRRQGLTRTSPSVRRYGEGAAKQRPRNEVSGFSKQGSKKKPKTPKLTQKAQTRQAMQKAGLHLSRADRVAEREAFKKKHGYYPARLSTQVVKPSKYKRKGVRKVVGSGGIVIGEVFIVKRSQKETISRKNAGMVKSAADKRDKNWAMKVQKENQRKIKGSGGSSSARKTGKRGGRPGREAKTLPKKKKK